MAMANTPSLSAAIRYDRRLGERPPDTCVVPERLDAAHACLLLFDTLNGYLKTPGGVQAEYRPAVANMQRLLDAARAARLMVAYAVGSHRTDGGMAYTPLTDTDNRLQPVTRRAWWRRKVVAGEGSGR